MWECLPFQTGLNHLKATLKTVLPFASLLFTLSSCDQPIDNKVTIENETLTFHITLSNGKSKSTITIQQADSLWYKATIHCEKWENEVRSPYDYSYDSNDIGSIWSWINETLINSNTPQTNSTIKFMGEKVGNLTLIITGWFPPDTTFEYNPKHPFNDSNDEIYRN